MHLELAIPANEKMKLKAKQHLEGLNPDDFNSVEELIQYVTYLHIATKEYLEIVAELLEEGDEHTKH